MLNNAGLSRFWQLFTLMLFTVALATFFTEGSAISPILKIISSILIFVGIATGYKTKNRSYKPWIFLLIAIAFIESSNIVENIPLFAHSINPAIPFILEETGLLFIALFSLCIMLMFEKQYRLNGFVIDFSLVVISVTCLFLFISPNLFSIFNNELDNQQRMLFVHMIFGIVLISLMLINQDLLNKIKTKDVILGLLISTLSAHFFLDYAAIYQSEENAAWMTNLSFLFYTISGMFAIMHIVTENYDFDYDLNSTKKLGMKFVWSASITALLVLPLGVMIRWKLGYPMIDQSFIAIASAFLSLIVIWRITILLKNYERQRQKIKHIAFTDSLTGMPNYLGFKNQVVAQNDLLVFCLNIEDFKSINDLHDRKFGDQVLRNLGKRIKNVPGVIFSARISGDNFLAVFKTVEQNIETQYRELSQKLGVWDEVLHRRVAVPLTYGASHSKNPIKPETLARQAESALKMSRMKHTDFTLFNNNEHDISTFETHKLPRHELREILQKAIDREYLPVHFQPIYNLKSGSLKALELLIRVESDNHGLLLPGQFLDQAKSYGMLTSLTKICIAMVAKDFDKLPVVMININVPPYMLNDSKILNEFIDHFHSANLPTERFCIEVTEDGDIPTEQLIPAIELLKVHGFTISMDDFGTGYSSLGRLSVLPVDSVKIDRSLLLTASNGDKAILESAINLVKRLGVSAIVEGVETLEQLDLVRNLGADSVQGYLFSKPVKVENKNQFLLNASHIVGEF